MLDPTIEDALTAFEASRTGGTASGKALAKKLREYGDKGDIGYDPLTPTQYGWSVPYHLLGKSIKVNSGFSGDIGGTSLVLAHEGVHRVKNTSSLDEELACFELQDDYYADLLAGVSFVSPNSKGKVTAQLSPGGFPEAEDVRKWRKNDQLIDFVLARGKYPEKLSAFWINANIGKWRGVANRWATTKGHYVRVLGSDVRNAQLILDILASVTQQAEWDELLRVAGSLAPAKDALRHFRTAPVARVQMLAVQNRWKADLGAK